MRNACKDDGEVRYSTSGISRRSAAVSQTGRGESLSRDFVKRLKKGVHHHVKKRREKRSGTDQGLARVRPVEFDAHAQLGVSGAAEHQPLPHRQPHLRRGQGEVIDLVSCGKGRGDMAVNPGPLFYR